MKKKRAFSLVELAIVIGVIGIVMSGIWYATATVQNRFKLSRAQQHVSVIIENLRRVFPPPTISWVPVGTYFYSSYDTSDANYLIFPPDTLSGSTVKNPWGLAYGASIILSGTSSNYRPYIAIDVQVPDVESCSRLASNLYAGLKNEKNMDITIGSDGQFGVVTNNPADTIVLCSEAQDAATSTHPTYLSIGMRL